MTWLQRYNFRNFIELSLWLVPMLFGMMAIICHRFVWKFDLLTHWQLLGLSLESIQVVRRLRAMLSDLLVHLPERRLPEVKAQLELLERFVERSFVDPVERDLAMSEDYKGLGGAGCRNKVSKQVQVRITNGSLRSGINGSI